MAALALGILPPPLLEGIDLGTAGLVDDFAGDAGARDERRADFRLAAWGMQSAPSPGDALRPFLDYANALYRLPLLLAFSWAAPVAAFIMVLLVSRNLHRQAVSCGLAFLVLGWTIPGLVPFWVQANQAARRDVQAQMPYLERHFAASRTASSATRVPRRLFASR